MEVIPDLKGATVRDFLRRNIEIGATIYTDGLKSFEGIAGAGYKHLPRTQPLRAQLRQGAKSVVPLADRVIGNLQNWLVGTHHGVSRSQLPAYLDEFVFRYNRRHMPQAAFQTVLGLGSSRGPTSYEQLRHGGDHQPQPVAVS